MSMKETRTFICPKCGKVNDFVMWHSLNGTVDPVAKQELMDGTLFDFTCRDCGYESRMNYEMIYHDIDNHVMIFYATGRNEEELEENIANFENTLDFSIPGYKKRIVIQQDSLREKAIIFENDLDDRVIEIIKLMYLAAVNHEKPDANLEQAFFMISDDKYILQLIGDKPFRAELSHNMYENIRNTYEDKLHGIDETGVFIDLDWALGFVREEINE